MLGDRVHAAILVTIGLRFRRTLCHMICHTITRANTRASAPFRPTTPLAQGPFPIAMVEKTKTMYTTISTVPTRLRIAPIKPQILPASNCDFAESGSKPASIFLISLLPQNHATIPSGSPTITVKPHKQPLAVVASELMPRISTSVGDAPACCT